jgi:hypothetical protein
LPSPLPALRPVPLCTHDIRTGFRRRGRRGRDGVGFFR